jgi:hypothetical protein
MIVNNNFLLGSKKHMLNLVHPSLYCFVAGVSFESETPVLPPLKFIGGGKVCYLFLLACFYFAKKRII